MSYSVNNTVVIDTNRNAVFANANVYLSVGHVYDNTTVFQGTVSGYTSGGTPGLLGTFSRTNVIDKFPFATDSPLASDVGDLTVARAYTTGQSSTVSGYTSGGLIPIVTNVIDKFPFATSSPLATDVGDLTVGMYNSASQSSSVSGYTTGGGISYPLTSLLISNIINKFPFAAEGNTTDVGDLSSKRHTAAGQSSSVSGYTSGGIVPGTSNIIDKFPFSTNSNASNVGFLSSSRGRAAGQSSSVSGYSSGGGAPGISNTIDKFPFATDSNASDVGDLSAGVNGRYNPAGQSSSVSGYTSGGVDVSTVYNNIDKFPFATDSPLATDVGDLTVARQGAAGQQD